MNDRGGRAGRFKGGSSSEDGAAPRLARDTPCLLLLDPDLSRAATLCAALRGRACTAVASQADSQVLLSKLRRKRFDVAVIAVDVGPLGGVRAAYDVAQSNPGCEIVLFASDGRSPEYWAARTVGVARIFPVEMVADWLKTALPALGRVVRARRALQEALSAVPPPPGDERLRASAEASAALPLYDAEQRFRESYLAGLIASAPTRREAAQRARVPYRTLSQMMMKLGLRDQRRSKHNGAG